MAGASMKSIKLRIHSMQNTRQITKAMEMVAASKMNKAQEKALRTRPYYTTLHSTLSGIAAATRDFSSPYLQKREEKRVCCVAIAGDRGLAGGYNSNVLRLAAETLTGEKNCVVPIGKKAGEYFRHRGAELLTEDWLTAEDLSVVAALHWRAIWRGCTAPVRWMPSSWSLPAGTVSFLKSRVCCGCCRCPSRKSPRQVTSALRIFSTNRIAPRCSMP